MAKKCNQKVTKSPSCTQRAAETVTIQYNMGFTPDLLAFTLGGGYTSILEVYMLEMVKKTNTQLGK